MTDLDRLLAAGDALAAKAEAVLTDPHGFIWKRAEFWEAYDVWRALAREVKSTTPQSGKE